jgi:hypothetical protein
VEQRIPVYPASEVALTNFTGDNDILGLHFFSPEAAARECPAAFRLSLGTKVIRLWQSPAEAESY